PPPPTPPLFPYTTLFRSHRNPIAYVREYPRHSRGMGFWRDVVDWLGGLPCEFASTDEVRAFAEARGFRLEHVAVGTPGANNEYQIGRASCRERVWNAAGA